MKPFGSITNIFPFIEQEEKELILKLIDNSSNYATFAENLFEHVISENSSELMIFLAELHLWTTFNFRAREKLLRRFSEVTFIRPHFSWYRMLLNGTFDWHVLLKEADDAITSNSHPLILLRLLTMKWTYVRGSSIGTLEEDRIIQELTELIQKNPSLDFARSHVSFLIADRYATENNQEKALQEYECALQQALVHDDAAFAASVQVEIAKLLSLSDPTKALEIIQLAASTEDELGYLRSASGLFSVLGVIFDARGEYNAAVKSYEEALELKERMRPLSSLRLLPTALSRSFRRMGFVKESLEWAKIALTSTPMMSRVQSLGLQVTSNLCMSAALALLGNVSEARKYLDIGQNKALQAGIEIWLSDVSLCEGLIARAEGNLIEAIGYFQSVLEIVERLQRQGRINECLFLLAETEIQYQISSLQSEGILASHWVSKMEEIAQNKNLVGVLGLSLLLKARIELNLGNVEGAKMFLDQIKELSKNPGTIFLQNKIEDLLSTYMRNR